MAVNRASVVDARFLEEVRSRTGRAPRDDRHAPVVADTTLIAQDALRLFEAQLTSRICDLVARELKARGEGFYTIGSSGHEGNAAVGGALEPDDLSFLHYRSGAYYLARAASRPGPDGAYDMLLGMVGSADEAIAGGRHKVFGSVGLRIPPQTSTIASHLPKAVGCAVALDRRARFEGTREDRIVVCSFGDASANHATATTAFNAAAWATYQHVPCPVLFVCEDNGFGISVRTPEGWIATNFHDRAGLHYVPGDGRWLPSAWDATQAALHHVRTQRTPAFLHLRTVRLLGHAGSDVEQLYRSQEEIEEAEAQDPVLATALMLIDEGWLQPDEVVALYENTRARIRALAKEAVRHPKLTTREEVMAPLAPHDPEVIAEKIPVAPPDERAEIFRTLPENQARPRHLAVQLNRALTDLMLAVPESLLFGEDVAKKGGVYHVTANLTERMGVGRVFNTLLDETTILGLAIGAGHAGMLPIPEIQYLAYLMNAIDQLRGEAGSMQFFSKGQYQNPMVVRIASLAYQKGFGGHFHNDNGIAALLEIPGLLIAAPARGDDAARMLRTLVTAAREQGRVGVFLEPIALYMTKDLHEDGDGAWLTTYPPPDQHVPVGEIGVYGDGTELCIATYANGLYMSLRVRERLEERGIRILDLRWLSPLPIEAVLPHAEACGRLLVVDECRANSGIADRLVAECSERLPGLRTGRVTGADSYIPLGAAANLVLVQEEDIERGILDLLEAS